MRSTSVFALGVGDIELHSALNQPLNAEIRLLSATPAELQGLTVALAPETAFISAGVDRPGFLNQLRFKVIQKSDGSHVIKVTSSQPIREPFLDFLVEVNWSSGRFVREYTVLLDFPVLEGGKPAPITAPTVTAPPAKLSAPEKTPETTPEPDSESSADNTDGASAESPTEAIPHDTEAAPVTRRKPVRQAPLQETASDGSYGPTQRADTLWDIALKMRPDASVSVSQVMLALAKNNPQAFFGNNVNNLMAGYILRLPPTDEIRAIPQQDAIREVATQYQQWLNVQRGGMVVPSAPGNSATGETEGALPGQDTTGAQLKLATPDSTTRGGSGGSGRKLSGDTRDVAALRKELAMALEAVDANRQENAELRSRMTQLEQQLTSMQRLLELKDGNLAALQNKKAANPPAVPSQPEATASPSTTGKSPTVPPAPAVAPTEPQETDLLGTLMGNQQQLGLLIGGFLIISALVWALVRRRRQSAIDSADESFAKLLKNSAVTDDVKKDDGAPAPAATNTAPEQGLPSTVMALSNAQTEEDMIDPLAEADVYLAYKRYDQAAELIKDAIRNDPTRPDLSLKLLEVYHLGKNSDAFETQAEALYAELNGDSSHPLWVKAIEMGKQTAPTHPLFFKAIATVAAATGGALAHGEATDAAATMDAMLGGPDETPLELPPAVSDNLFAVDTPQESATLDAEPPKAAITDNSIDFNLDAPSSPMDITIEDSAPAEPVTLASNTLDFDLNLHDAAEALSVTDNAAPLDLADEQPLPMQDPAPISNEMEFDYNLTPARHDTHEDHDHPNGYDHHATLPEASALKFDLDDPAITAFDGTAPDDAAVSAETENDLFVGIDMVGTKLDLAKAYIDMEDKEGARMLLNEVLNEGSAPQKNEARELMQQIA
jgi:pilus assembly protein FimV